MDQTSFLRLEISWTLSYEHWVLVADVDLCESECVCFLLPFLVRTPPEKEIDDLNRTSLVTSNQKDTQPASCLCLLIYRKPDPAAGLTSGTCKTTWIHDPDGAVTWHPAETDTIKTNRRGDFSDSVWGFLWFFYPQSETWPQSELSQKHPNSRTNKCDYYY